MTIIVSDACTIMFARSVNDTSRTNSRAGGICYLNAYRTKVFT